MTCRDFNLDNLSSPGACYAIEQGINFNWLTLYYQNQDISNYTPVGQIRTNYADLSENILATFQFEPLIYGTVNTGTETFEATVIRPFLTHDQTQTIPATRNRTASDRVFIGRNAFVYDIKLISPTGERLLLTRGLVQVIPDVTRI